MFISDKLTDFYNYYCSFKKEIHKTTEKPFSLSFVETIFCLMEEDGYETLMIDFKNNTSTLSFQNKNGTWESFCSSDKELSYKIGCVLYNIYLEHNKMVAYSPKFKLEGYFNFNNSRYYFLNLPGKESVGEFKVMVSKVFNQ